ncbi:hypothetical protein LR48_Vigan07g190400 [Vigna angularis]|uniref:Retrotransposon gag domain-containing protein n=1 Tax=Phaseolus angularis TaxID=3914 RepID=A0A0L9UZB1_PHAAN|nr:hypothetical protein LR48_Vigan07g190400 [Vigna angularis]
MEMKKGPDFSRAKEIGVELAAPVPLPDTMLAGSDSRRRCAMAGFSVVSPGNMSNIDVKEYRFSATEYRDSPTKGGLKDEYRVIEVCEVEEDSLQGTFDPVRLHFANDAIIYKYFPAILKEAALEWWIDLPSYSIDCFNTLTKAFPT